MNVNNVYVAGDALIFEVSNAEALAFAAQFKPGRYEVKRVRQKRSNDANAFLWELCTQIATATGVDKVDVYRRNIREGNEYTPLPIVATGVEEFQRLWSSHGIGWFCDVVDNSKIPGYKLLFAYHGSSEYDSKQMSDLINRVIQDAEAIGIPTLPPQELAQLE
jgi:hypothetical protein